MSRWLLAVAVMTALIVTGASPSYCAEMLAAIAGHHHHHDSGALASGHETRQIVAGWGACSHCGERGARAVTSDGRAKLTVTPESDALGLELDVSVGQRPAAASSPSYAVTPPLLTPLRI